MRCSVFALVFGIALVVMQPAQAAEIQIQLGGVDIGYDGSQIEDADVNGNDPDPLTNATFVAGGSTQYVDMSGVTLDFDIPDLFNIPVGGGQVLSAAGGNFDLQLGGGEHLTLTLQEAQVSYTSFFGTIDFVFAGSAANINSQNLPAGLTVGEPVSVSFSTRVTPGSVTDDGTYLTAFEASGTGEIQAIPEPASLSLLALGAVALLRRRRV